MGLAVAWVCTQRGARVQVIDPRGVGGGASGGIVGALAPHVPENWNPKKAYQFDSLIRAGAFWDGVKAAGGLSPGYGRTGRLQPLADDHAVALAQSRAQQAETLWQGHASWRVDDAAAFGDWAPPSPTGKVIHDTLSARLHPAQACAALAAALRASGGSIAPEGTPRGAVIWATGYEGLAALSEHFQQPMGNGVKGQAALLRLDQSAAPQLFADGVHFVPHADGTLAVGSTSERAFEAPDTTDEQLDHLLSKARTLVPAIADAPVLKRWAGVRPRARTRAPMLGAWPGRDGHFIANGGFKIGFGMAPKMAEDLTELVLTGRNTIPDDFQPQASMKRSP